MEYVQLGNSQNLKVSRLCIGGDPFGGYGWGTPDFDEYIRIIRACIEEGVNFFDTADCYGLGKSEEVFAEGIKGHREDVVLQTKFGVLVKDGKTTYHNEPEYIRSCLESSLKRLKTDYIDIYVMHYRDGVTPFEAVAEELVKLRQEGKVRYFGLSNLKESDLDELEPYADLFVNCQQEYSLARRIHEKTLSDLQNRFQITPMSWSSLGRGVLTGKYHSADDLPKGDKRTRELDYMFHGETFQKSLAIVEQMRSIAPHYDKTLAAVALRFILDYLRNSVVLVGVKSMTQFQQNLDAFGWHLSSEDLSLLDEISK